MRAAHPIAPPSHGADPGPYATKGNDVSDFTMKMVNDAVASVRAAQLAASDQMTLGQIIDACKAIPARDDLQIVVFDFEYARPTSFNSWRGIYAELAITFSLEGHISLRDFIALADGADGDTFTGYKGGEFTMTRETPVWVANYGNAGSTAVVGVYDDGYQVVLMTAYRPT